MQSEIKTKCIIVREGKSPFPVEAAPDQDGIIRMYCVLDSSISCTHAKFSWTLPEVQEMVQRMYAEMREIKEAVQC
jgi:hypothetical protein